MKVRGPAFAGAVLVSAVALVVAGVVLLSATGGEVEAAPQERADYVPFLGEFNMSCTWGTPSGARNPCRMNGVEYHPYKALDFQLPNKTAVTAAGAGVVTFAGDTGKAAGFGIAVLVYHSGDNRTSLYAHLDSHSVSKGERVLAGQPLGLSGRTGLSIGGGGGYHLHYAEAPDRRERAWGRGGPGVDPGSMIGTRQGRRVAYPQAMGVSNWTAVNLDPDVAPRNPHRIGRERMPELPGDWAGYIVHWDGDRKAQKTSWLVSPRFLRNHIESSAQFNCLKNSHPGPVKLPSATLDQLVDQRHQPVTECADRPAGQSNSEVAAAPVATLAPLPPSPHSTMATLPPAPPGGQSSGTAASQPKADPPAQPPPTTSAPAAAGDPPPSTPPSTTAPSGPPPSEAPKPPSTTMTSASLVADRTIRGTFSVTSSQPVTRCVLVVQGVREVAGACSSIDVGSLAYSTTYTVYAYAESSAGRGPNSNTLTVRTNDAPPPPPPPPPTISLSKGARATYGYWYSVVLSNFAPGSQVTVACHDSRDRNFYTQTFTIGGDGRAADSTLCYSADGPDHWVTGGGVESNHVSW